MVKYAAMKIYERNKLGARDFAIALAIGAVATIGALVFSLKGPDPADWEEIAVASRIIPPSGVFPGLWRLWASTVAHLIGTAAFLKLLDILGALAVGAIASLIYFIIRELLHFLLLAQTEYDVWNKRIVPYFAAFASVLAACSDPILSTCQIFTADAFALVMMVLLIQLWLRWLSLGRAWRLYILTALSGMLAAETPFALILPIVFVIGYHIFWVKVMNGHFRAISTLPDPDKMPRWRTFFLFLASLGFAVWVSGETFTMLGGLAANEWSMNDIYFRYSAAYGKSFFDSSTLIGWILGLGFGVLPLVVVLKLFTRSVGDHRPMPFRYGVMLVFAAAMAVLQSGAFPAARFWAMMKEIELVPSRLLLSMFVICSIAALAIIGAAFAFECQRKYLRQEDTPPGPLLRGLVPAMALVIAILAAIHVPRPVEKQMQQIVNDSIEEILNEADDAKWLFTDGRLDAAILLAAGERGSVIKPLNMLSGGAKVDVFIRERYFEKGSVERDLAKIGIDKLFGTWYDSKPERMNESAVQFGLWRWKRPSIDGREVEMPPCSGFLARPGGFKDEAELERGIKAAEEIAARILELSSKRESARPSRALDNAFAAVTWRIAWFARMRNDTDLSQALNRTNRELKQDIVKMEEEERRRTFQQSSPKDLLHMALRKADFAEAQRYAQAVLKGDEYDLEANFAMGMWLTLDNRPQQAEMYLRRCLKVRPNEPVVLNNLSIVLRKAKKYEEAEELARQALKFMPDSAEVKKTLDDAINRAL